ncbi:MAG: phenylalanine--tRNA ligase subunit beta [Deltaproteobacteria bacterium]|nr:phenylalanine--tRNA ligase subunit beta [Deltaproteobacteria bacterium]
MYVSYRWLSRHVDLTGISPEQLCDDLTLSTAEVEGLERFAPHLSDVVVGSVLAREKHPDADKLSVCTVDIGQGEPATIVCGAPNVATGQKVAVATPGTVLPGDFKIKKSKIRGVTSAGMICSVSELELGDEHDGIWVLPDEAAVGVPVADALGVDDWVIEIDNKSLTHRPDLWGHRGIAGELGAIYSRALQPLCFEMPAHGQATPYPVQIESEACSRYVALPIDGARAQTSPDWLRWLLLAVGQRPIDLLVDLSNFVMLDIGQPNHTFDRQRLSDQGITVRMASAGETMQTLDGEERKLQPSDLLICSDTQPVALAGIMGGEGSKVGDDTKALLLEVATFDATTVRRTSSRLGLRTDSSARFEKSLDPTMPMRAAAYFARLLQEIQPEVSLPAAPTDAGDWTDPAHSLMLRTERVRQALGKPIPDEEIGDILGRLGFVVEAQNDGFAVGVPSPRATKDVTIERDLVEEVGRIYRYGNIAERVMTADVRPPPPDERRVFVRRIQDRLAGSAHFHEAIGYSFVDDDLLEKLGMLSLPHVRVVNPANQGQDKVRRSIVPSLLSGLETNRRRLSDVRLFEVGKGYLPEHSNDRGEPRERHLVGLVLAAPPPGKQATFDADGFTQLYGVVTDLLDALGLEAPEWSAGEALPSWAHPNKALCARYPDHDEPAVILADLEPGLAPAFGLSGDLTSDVALAEISLDALLDAPRRGSRYRPIPRFPGIKVDVAVALPTETPSASVVESIIKAGKGSVADIELFDLYRGESIGADRKSLAYHVLLQSESRTLTDKDERKFLKRFEELLGELGADLRGGSG